MSMKKLFPVFVRLLSMLSLLFVSLHPQNLTTAAPTMQTPDPETGNPDAFMNDDPPSFQVFLPLVLNDRQTYPDPVVLSITVRSAADGDENFFGSTMILDQGYTVDQIELNMSEPVIVYQGAVVRIVGFADYGTLSGAGTQVIITPYESQRLCALIGTFSLKAPTGAIRAVDDNTSFTDPIGMIIQNVPPLAINDSYSGVEDYAFFIFEPGVLTNDTDFDPDFLIAVLESNPANGSLILNPNGSFQYTPDADFNGLDSFTYRANDGLANSNIATVSINVAPLNDTPVADPQSIITAEDTSISITLTGSDEDGDPLTYEVVDQPAFGTLSGVAPDLNYTPDLNYFGPDSFTFVVNDGDDNSSPAEVTITIDPVNDAPVAYPQEVTTPEDLPLSITLTGFDVEGTTLDYSVISLPLYGILAGTAPELQYSPDENFNGSDSFTFTVEDGEFESQPALVSISITAVNDAPVALADTYNVAKNADLTILPIQGVLINDDDVDGDSITAELVSSVPVGEGSLTLYPDGSFQYQPPLDWVGVTSFSYEASDGVSYSNTAYVSILVQETNTAPTGLELDDQTIPENQPIGTMVGAFSTQDTPGDTFTYTLVSSESYPDNAHFTITGNKLRSAIVFNYEDPDHQNLEIMVRTTDQGGLWFERTFTITVIDLNDAPIAHSQTQTSLEDTHLVLTLTGEDPDGDPLTFLVALPAHGTLSGSAPDLDYTPHENYNGTDQFSFNVSDGSLISNTATVTIDLTPVNDAPVAQPQSVSTPEDTPKPITLVGFDVDEDPLTYLIETDPGHGSLTGDIPDLIYLPAENYYGVDSFSFKVFDDQLYSEIVTVNISIAPVNDLPVADPQSVTTQEDIALDITLTGSDVESSVLTFTITVDPDHGEITGSAPNLTYSPDPDYFGLDSFSFVVHDGSEYSLPADINIDITPVNDAPEIIEQVSLNTLEETALTIILGHLSVIDPDNTYPDDFTLTVLPGTDYTLDGHTITPVLDFVGTLSVPVVVNDGLVDSNTYYLTVTVLNVNDAPLVSDIPDTTFPVGLTELTINLDDYVDDVDDDDAEIIWTYSGAAELTVSITDRIATITMPYPTWSGEETITFRATDPGGLYAEDAAVFVDDDLALVQAGTSITGTLANFTAAFPSVIPDNVVNEGYYINSQIILSEELPAGSLVTITRNGFTIVENATLVGTSFWIIDLMQTLFPGATPALFNHTYDGQVEVYTVHVTADESALNIAVTVNSVLSKDFEAIPLKLITLAEATFILTEVNDAPEITGQVALSTPEETALTILLDHLTVDDSDNTYPNDFTLTVLPGTDYTLDGHTITPVLDFVGTLSVPVVVNDGLVDSNTYYLTVTVENINDLPLVSDIPDTTFPVGLTELTINLDDYVDDVDNNDADIIWTYSGAAELTVRITDQIATITTPYATWSGEETITFRATDPGGLYAEDPAVFVDDDLALVQAGTSITGTLANFTATFPSLIPDNVVNEGYYINSQIILSEELPAGSLVTIIRNGFTIVENATLVGTSFWIIDLMQDLYPGATPALFDHSYDGQVEVYTVTVTGNAEPINIDVTVNSVLSRNFDADPLHLIILAEATFELIQN